MSQLSAAQREPFRGRELRPQDADYDTARRIWNARIDRRPALIVQCADTADIVAGVHLARESGLPLSIRGGGHHTAGHAVCDGGVMLDLSHLRAVVIDPERRVARVQPGVRVRDLDAAAQPHGLMTTGAAITTPGMAGYTLGGGLGWTSRLHGLACDNLLSARVVTAAGEVVDASEDENADLFWALRGGGGNFGVVVSFDLRLHELGPDVLAGAVIHPMQDAPAMLRLWRDYMLTAPDTLQCMPVVFPLPPAAESGKAQGDTAFALFLLWAGDPAEGVRELEPLRRAGQPLADGVRLANYATLLSDLDDMYRSGHRNYYRSVFFDDLPDEGIDALVTAIGDVPTPFSSAFLEPLGGAIARVPPDATAFPHRQRKFCATVVPKWESDRDDAALMAWADDIAAAVRPFAAEGVYVNYLDEIGGDAARLAYGPNRNRLAEVKMRWDPDNLFRSNHNIRPG